MAFMQNVPASKGRSEDKPPAWDSVSKSAPHASQAGRHKRPTDSLPSSTNSPRHFPGSSCGARLLHQGVHDQCSHRSRPHSQPRHSEEAPHHSPPSRHICIRNQSAHLPHLHTQHFSPEGYQRLWENPVSNPWVLDAILHDVFVS